MAVKTNERPGTRAVLRHAHLSSYKAREVLELVRGVSYSRAVELLDHTDRGAAPVVAKLLRSAAANAEHNEGLDPEELYVATCYADEGTTMKRWRPRARGRATRIRKRTCHITVVLARMPEDQLSRLRSRREAEAADRRARRVAGTRRRRGEATAAAADTAASEAPPAATVEAKAADAALAGSEEAAGEAIDGGEPEEAEAAGADAGADAEAGGGEDGSGAGDVQSPGEDS